MGRKKRPASSTATASSHKRSNTSHPSTAANHHNNHASTATGKATGKSKAQCFPIKKYRPDKHYPSMDLFLRYTKTHKMVTDAVYEEYSIAPAANVNAGGNKSVKNNNAKSKHEKPYIFRVRVGTHVLGYGRGKTRDESIDNAIRASFYLVQAHGYDTGKPGVLDMNEDCLTKEPELPVEDMQGQMMGMGQMAVKVPPPPPPLGPPPGTVPATGFPPPPASMAQPAAIPQPQVHAMSNYNTIAAPTTKLHQPVQIAIAAASSTVGTSHGLAKKRVSNLVYEAEEGVEECSMEEKRARQPRYVMYMPKTATA